HAGVPPRLHHGAPGHGVPDAGRRGVATDSGEGSLAMDITPDTVVYWQIGSVKISATLVYTWVVMAILVLGSWLVTRRLSTEPSLSRGQSRLEGVVDVIRGQIRDVSQHDPERYLRFIGTLFLFIAVSNTLAIVPGFRPPTGSLSTTTALAVCVFAASP